MNNPTPRPVGGDDPERAAEGQPEATTGHVGGTAASIVESIRFIRVPGSCEWGNTHDQYGIAWTGPDGVHHYKHTYWCSRPQCPGSDSPWKSVDRPHVMLTCWVPPGASVAVAYLLVLTSVKDGRVVTEMQARVGICGQWTDRQYGNVEEPGEPHRLFTERYFAESGPGVYPAEIVEVRS